MAVVAVSVEAAPALVVLVDVVALMLLQWPHAVSVAQPQCPHSVSPASPATGPPLRISVHHEHHPDEPLPVLYPNADGPHHGSCPPDGQPAGDRIPAHSLHQGTGECQFLAILLL